MRTLVDIKLRVKDGFYHDGHTVLERGSGVKLIYCSTEGISHQILESSRLKAVERQL